MKTTASFPVRGKLICNATMNEEKGKPAFPLDSLLLTM